jgi:glycosyltransferase involved in cell wall biosynthesis
MRIITLINGLNNGGAEKFAVEMCNELSLRHEVFLLVKSSLNESSLPRKKLNDNVKLIVFNSGVKWDLFFALKLFTTLLKLKPNVIHLHSSILIFYTFFCSKLLKGCKIVHTIHSQVTPAYIKVVKWSRTFRPLGCQIEHVVISEKIGSEFIKVFPDIPFVAIENGVEPLVFRMEVEDKWKDHRKRLVAIGNFTDAKRFDLLSDVMVFPEIASRYTLQIIGFEKAQDQPVTRYIIAKEAENIELVGLRENVGDYLNHADGLVIWSSFEGMPLVMLEALSMGCPVISSPVGGIPDVIQSGQCGILTKGLNQVDLKEALIQFDNLDEQDFEGMRQRCKDLFQEKFTMNICSRKYESLFNSQA